MKAANNKAAETAAKNAGTEFVKKYIFMSAPTDKVYDSHGGVSLGWLDRHAYRVEEGGSATKLVSDDILSLQGIGNQHVRKSKTRMAGRPCPSG